MSLGVLPAVSFQKRFMRKKKKKLDTEESFFFFFLLQAFEEFVNCSFLKNALSEEKPAPSIRLSATTSTLDSFTGSGAKQTMLL